MGPARACLLLLLVGLFSGWSAAQNSGPGLPRSLVECYLNRTLYARELRIPASVAALTALVDRVERVPGINMDMRTLSTSLVHRFRTDGVVRDPTIPESNDIAPFLTAGFQNGRYRLLVEKLLPGNAVNFPNSSLTGEERCSLHYLTSTTVDRWERGDENTVCSRLQNFRSMPLRPRRGISEDVETLSGEEETEISGKTARQTQIPPESFCPIEEGVIYTPWGAVSAGALMAGIAAGLQRQQVGVRQMSLTPLEGANSPRAMNDSGPVDNLYAATFTGDLGELVLRQAPRGQVIIGGGGGWNDTSMPRHYFLTRKDNYEMSEAEVRGGLDGLILGTAIQQLQSSLNRLTISQVLEMYYSERGIPTERNLRACQRKDHTGRVASNAKLVTETRNIIPPLQHYVQGPVVSDTAMESFINNAVSRLLAFIPTLNDKACETQNETPSPNDRLGSPAVDLTLVLDPTWMYEDALPTLAAILQEIPPHASGSSLTLFMGSQNEIPMINYTRSILDFYGNFTQERYRFYSSSQLEVTRSLAQLRGVFATRREDEKRRDRAGGRSQTVLFIAHTATGASDQQGSLFMANEARIFRESSPDTRLLFMSSGNKDKFRDLVLDPERDLFLLSPPGFNGKPDVRDVVKRLTELPARLTNPSCGAKWDGSPGDDGGGQGMQFYADPLGITYYRLLPNFFFTSNEVIVRFQGAGQGRVTVCYSRVVEQPRSSGGDPGQGGTVTGDVECRQLASSESTEFRVSKPCQKSWHAIDCRPLYFSVVATETTNRCMSVNAGPNTEDGCRYPDMVRFTVTANNLGCHSGAAALRFAGPLIILLAALRLVLAA